MNTASRIGSSLGAYFRTLVQNAVISILLFIAGLAIAGVPWWFLTGFVCGIVNLIPHLGSVLALGLALLVTYLGTSDDWVRLAIVGGVWLVIQILEGFVLSPRAAGKAGVHPLLSIVLVFAAGLLFGPIGMLLAVPVTAVILIIWRASRHA